MNLNPYKVLGIPKDATDADILRAYRRRVFETHPDHGGNIQSFSEVALAKLVLLDPERRAQYDRDGTIDEPSVDDVDGEALAILATHVDLLLAGMGEAEAAIVAALQINLVSAIKDKLEEEANAIQAQIDKQQRRITAAFKIRLRLRKKGAGENGILERLLEAQDRQAEGKIKIMGRDLRIRRLAAALLDGYDFERDHPNIRRIVPNLDGNSFTFTETY